MDRGLLARTMPIPLDLWGDRHVCKGKLKGYTYEELWKRNSAAFLQRYQNMRVKDPSLISFQRYLAAKKKASADRVIPEEMRQMMSKSGEQISRDVELALVLVDEGAVSAGLTPTACSQSASLNLEGSGPIVTLPAGITHHVQVSDTHVHKALHDRYRRLLSELPPPPAF